MKEQLEITDVYKTATFLCNGMNLVEVRKTERNIISFVIEGEGLKKLDCDYGNGLIRINPLEFRNRLNQLRDLMFAEKRKNYEQEVVCA